MTRLPGLASALLAALLALAACTGAPTPRAPLLPPLPEAAVHATLPSSRAAASDLVFFRQPEAQPPILSALPLEPGRAYAILIQLPAPAPVDLTDPTAARNGLRRFLNPVAIRNAGTGLGHAMVGWRCSDDPAPHLAGKSGDSDNLGLRLLLAGWGLAGFFSDYDDGHLQAPGGPGTRNGRAIDRGKARIVAFEIEQADCDRMRMALRRYMADPEGAVRPYGMLPRPDQPFGEGCAGFALWLASQGGVFAGGERHFLRRVPLSDRYIGVGRAVAGQVVPFRPAAEPLPGRLSPWRLLLGRWHGGRDLGEIEILDMELMLVALDRALALAGPGWQPAPRLRPDDPAVVAVARDAERWLSRFHRVTPLRMGPARAVVLHRS